MDLMSDYSQQSIRFASLKFKRTQSNNNGSKINQTAQIPRDFINCCVDRNMMVPCTRYSGNMMMRWCNVLVFSVVVLIHIASINCIAARQIEGELAESKLFLLPFLINWVEVYRAIIIAYDYGQHGN